MITADAPFKSAPRISRDRFRRVFFEHAAPEVLAERDPGAFWDVCVEYGVDPLFVAAMFHHESQMGKEGIARTTHSFGNTRAPSFGAVPIGEVPGRTGKFPVFRDWLDGCKSTVARLVEPTWVYAGRTTIREIFDHPSGKVWAPAGDLNDPYGYLAAVLRDMNAWAEKEVSVAGDDPRFKWLPDTEEYGYPAKTRGRNGRTVDYLILHITEGTDSSAWLRGENGSSTHYLTNRDATPREQHVREADAAWTAGSRDYNERGINIEFERRAKDAWTDQEYRNAAATVLPIARRHNVPLVYLGRNSVGVRGFIGHEHVPDGAGGWGGSTHHSDPGPRFDWGRFMVELRALDKPPTPDVPRPAEVSDPGARYFPETGFWIQWGFKGYWEANPNGLMDYGYPLTNEVDEDGRPVQYFERAVFEWHADKGRVLLRRLGADALERKAA